jgi:4-amino-4-deoxy-L-arabinose transferase-like glycosyltransferase
MWRGVVLVVLCSLTFLTGLGRTAIQDSDEAYYAEAAREMVVSGDWTTPYYNFEPRFAKPILLYWLIAATYVVAGVGEAAARFWPALSGLGMAVVAFLAGARWSSRDAGLLAGVIVATSFGVVPFARQSLPDMPLAFFVTLSIWAAIEACLPLNGSTPAARRSRPHHWLYGSAVAAALGMLMKGPVAVALLVAVLLPLVLWERWARTDRTTPGAIRAGHVAVAIVIFVAIAAPWYVAVTLAQGPEYLRQFFVGENIDRFATAQYNAWRGHLYLPIIVGGLLPWSAFGLLWLPALTALVTERRRFTAVERRLLCWTVGPLAFFMVSIGSQPRYILPCLVPLAILLARTIRERAVRPRAPRDGLFLGSSVAAGLTVTTAGILMLRARPLLTAASPDWSPVGPVAIVTAGALVVVWALAGSRRWIPAVVGAAAAAAVMVFETAVLAPGRPEPVEVIARVVRDQNGTSPVCACGALARSLTFYTQRKTYLAATDRGDADVMEFLTRDERLFAAVDAQVLARVEARLDRRFARLADVRYLGGNVRQQPATLLDPDPGLVQHIILVTTQ